jgi:Icc-related predicted phosphoesterase
VWIDEAAATMKIIVISDLHGEFDRAMECCGIVQPDLLLCCGDWGDLEEIAEAGITAFLDLCPILTTFGNHDSLDLLARMKNRDGSDLLIGQGKVRVYHGLTVAAIGGIWAKSHKLRHYVTDADVVESAERIARSGPVDVLLTHACPVGLADLTPAGNHGGQRCFLEASKRVAPRLHCCGHLHVAQEKVLKDGRRVVNVGATPEGSYAVIDLDPQRREISCVLKSLPDR